MLEFQFGWIGSRECISMDFFSNSIFSLPLNYTRASPAATTKSYLKIGRWIFFSRFTRARSYRILYFILRDSSSQAETQKPKYEMYKYLYEGLCFRPVPPSKVAFVNCSRNWNARAGERVTRKSNINVIAFTWCFVLGNSYRFSVLINGDSKSILDDVCTRLIWRNSAGSTFSEFLSTNANNRSG